MPVHLCSLPAGPVGARICGVVPLCQSDARCFLSGLTVHDFTLIFPGRDVLSRRKIEKGLIPWPQPQRKNLQNCFGVEQRDSEKKAKLDSQCDRSHD